jgi:hypothetical protein
VPVIKSVAVADENPTSARLKVRDLEAFSQLITTARAGINMLSTC